RPNGIHRARDEGGRRRSPNEWAENAPQPSRTTGPSAQLDAPETQRALAPDAGGKIAGPRPKFLPRWATGTRDGSGPGAAANGGGMAAFREHRPPRRRGR